MRINFLLVPVNLGKALSHKVETVLFWSVLFMMLIFVLLVFSIILVNGWTDAPNAISTCVATRSLSPPAALALAAVCNFGGAVGMAMLSSSVAKTVFGIANLPSDPEDAIGALCAAMSAVVIWAVIATRFGIPTSESHALISGLAGAAIASQRTLAAINKEEMLRVLFGLLLSTAPAFLLAEISYSVMIAFLGRRERRRVIKRFSRTQILSAASSALLHGAQDSQKFMGVLMLGISLRYSYVADTFHLPPLVVISCAAVMTLGTLLGGKSIIKKVGVDMVSLDAAGGTAADFASSAVLTLCSFLGLPVSTTHSKASAMMGVGAQKHGGGTNKKIVGEILLAWLLTFPVCAAIGFLLTALYLTLKGFILC